MITIEKRFINSDNNWEFDTIYLDGCEGGEQREKDYADYMKTKDDGVYEYKITVE